VCAKGEFVPSDGACVGDIVVLTKPLGTQVAVNVHQWRCETNNSNQKYWNLCKEFLTDEQAEEMMHQAVCSMVRLNKNGGRLMLKYKAHAATDVTGFGLLGHAQNLMENQQAEVGMEIHTLPFLKGTKAINDHVFDFRLSVGYSAETSGGLMVCLPPSLENAQAYCDELEQLDGTKSWIIGRVVTNPDRKARIVETVQFLEV
jgi:selenide,water dikinase